MAEKILKCISDEIKKQGTLIVDSSPGAVRVHQLILALHVLDGKSRDRFLKFLPSVGYKAHERFDAITLELEKLNKIYKTAEVSHTIRSRTCLEFEKKSLRDF